MYQTTHSVLCEVPVAKVYQLIINSSEWPNLFEPCIAVKSVEAAPAHEIIEITALVNGTPTTWRSRRDFSPDIYVITSTVLTLMPLVGSMVINWNVFPINEQQCVLVMEHEYTLCESVEGLVGGVNTIEQAQQYIEAAIDKNSKIELQNIKAAVEQKSVSVSNRQIESSVHSRVFQASAERLYSIIRDSSKWPEALSSCVRTSVLESLPGQELIRVEALIEGQHASWITKRQYHDDIFRVNFMIREPMPFLQVIHGQWRVTPLGPDQSLLSVRRTWKLVEDIEGIRTEVQTPEQAHAFVAHRLNTNTEKEMESICAYLEGHDNEVLIVREIFQLPMPVQRCFDLIAEVQRWPSFIPHCESIDLCYDDGINQEFVMRVRTKKGSEAFRSVRYCDRQALTIRYFQPEPPAILSSHRGSWLFKSSAGGTEVVATHWFTLSKKDCVAVFGTDEQTYTAEIEQILRANSRATIEACNEAVHATL